MTDRGKWIEAEGDKPKVEPTRRFFAEIRASLKNGLDASRDLEAECERLRAAASAVVAFHAPPSKSDDEVTRPLAALRAALGGAVDE